ncbi:MAG TPA: hypothetical protein VFJ58_15250 [Armatimonadota bacterium]|nr:hypothetical protein [Armatimonadota bacterium]
MSLSYASRCGNPECERGKLPPGAQVVVLNKRIYCCTDCATTHAAAAPVRKPRATSRTAKSKK